MIDVIVDTCPDGCLRMTFVGTAPVVAVVKDETATPVRVTFQR